MKIWYFEAADPRCVDPATGALLDRYLRDRLDAKEMSIFTEHLLSCVPCALTIRNARSLRAEPADGSKASLVTVIAPPADVLARVVAAARQTH